MLQHGGRFPAPKGYTPDLQWQKLQTANFAELRQVLNLLKITLCCKKKKREREKKEEKKIKFAFSIRLKIAL